MAVMHPPRPIGKSHAERRTYCEVERQLDSSWHAFQNVAWVATGRSRRHDGECDLLLLHPAVGLIALEVKGGVIRIEDGQWYSLPHGAQSDVPIRDPFEQA